MVGTIPPEANPGHTTHLAAFRGGRTFGEGDSFQRVSQEDQDRAAALKRAAAIGVVIGKELFHAGFTRTVRDIEVAAGSPVVILVGPAGEIINVQLEQLEQEAGVRIPEESKVIYK